MPFWVTRQRPFGQPGVNLVEISQGSRDTIGCDALVEKYPGEWEGFVSLTEAVTAAIAVRDAWIKDWRPDRGTEQPMIGIGNNHGGMIEIMPSESTDEELMEKAAEFDEKLPRCDRCGEILPDKGIFTLTDYPDFRFCREYCAEAFYASEQNADDAAAT